MLSLYKLEIFAVVVQAGSFSAAAQRLYMTQPAVSQHIQDLESSLGTSLFLRGRRGVSLTPAGEKLYDYTQMILRLVAEAESEVTNVENISARQISIGATPGVSVYLLPEWLRGFRDKFPNLNIAVQTSITTDHITGVMDHTLDIGFVEGELDRVQRKGLGYLGLRPVTLLVVVGAQHPWANRASVTLDMLNNQPFITRQLNSRTRVWMDNLFAEHRVTPHIIAEFDNQEAIKQAVMSNMGVTILPDYAVVHEKIAGLLHTLPVEGVDLQRELKLIYDAEAPFSPIARALLVHLSALFPQIRSILGKG
jgi:LysR family transcriptional regulator, low CO2-responsive transcriptional regulator